MDMIWEDFELLSILLLEILEFWRILFENIKLLHDEFLYDESFKFLPQLNIHAYYIRKTSIYFSTYKH